MGTGRPVPCRRGGGRAPALSGRVDGTMWSDVARHAASRAGRSAHSFRSPQAHFPARLQHILSRTYRTRSFMQAALRPPWAVPRRSLNSIRPMRVAACRSSRASHHIHKSVTGAEPCARPIMRCADARCPFRRISLTGSLVTMSMWPYVASSQTYTSRRTCRCRPPYTWNRIRRWMSSRSRLRRQNRTAVKGAVQKNRRTIWTKT